MKHRISILLVMLVAAGAWLLWPHARRAVVKKFAAPAVATVRPASTAPKITFASRAASGTATNAAAARTNRFAYRLSNTAKTIGQLTSDRHAILLENALIDTGAKLDLAIPKNLAAAGDPGAFIVQARGPVDAAFRAALAAAGAQVVSYIPNNALLVRLAAGAADGLAADARVQAVLPYEPYYKLESALLPLAVNGQALPAGQVLTLGLFSDGAAATVEQIEKLGGTIVGRDRSPFGPVVRVQPPADWLALAQLSGVQIVEPAARRVVANDLTRVTEGVATNTVTGTNYLGLTGKNVIVEVNDTGIDATHPDFTATGTAATGPAGGTRVTGDSTNSLDDIDGHGTHVAGIIAGNGAESYTVSNTPSGSVTNADFRGKAPLATLFSVGFLGANDFAVSDSYLQETPAKTNALISNNSWVNEGSSAYDLSAASYDAAVRDAVPETTGLQPVLFVFAAGNDGNGNNDGGGGTPDSIDSPATAKNVITVGALESDRNITNTYLPLDSTNPVATWQPQTDSSSQVAFYSSRGNVGIGTEGTYGRFKPDVVAPGTFIVSTRSTMWNQAAYYNPTNYYDNYATDQVVDTNGLNYFSFSDFGFVVPSNTVDVSLQINILSPASTPTNMPVYVSLTSYPNPADGTTYDFVTTKDNATIPPDGPANYLNSIINNFGDFNFAIGDSTNVPVTYDLLVQMVTTNDLGNYYQVLSNLNDTIGPWYRYESGTSMSAASISGVLALMQDFFTNTLQRIPSPALLKAMLINGARPTGFYNFQVNNPINFEGWGLVNLPNSLPSTLTNTAAASATNSFFFVDQSPTNALATGDSRTYQLGLSPAAQTVPLRLTLAWTDPPGNPAAAIKLVNNLDLIVTNTDNPTNPVVYYGNDIAANQVYNTQENPTNSAGIADAINNVENVFLPANSGTNFTVVIYGTAVNVNAVTTQTNNLQGAYAPNIVQDFAFVIASGNGANTNGFSLAAAAASNPTGDQLVTVVTNNTPSPLLNQFVGAATPVATNTQVFGAGSPYVTNALVTIGQTNQWHFYVITNNGLNSAGQNNDVTNAAFVTFLPPTAALPREGVFAGSDANSTRPEADIDLYVATDSSLTNLNPNVISNCINSAQVGASSPAGVTGTFYGAALDRGGSEFVVDSNSTPGQVYYVGVKSEDQTAAEYAFLSEFSDIPFSSQDAKGNQYVTFFPVNIPDGDATHPGYTNTLGLCIYPIEIQRVVVTNFLAQQNVGDLVVSLNHPTVAGGNGSVVLLNHDSPNAPGIYTNIYDDSGQGDYTNSQRADGPGTLNSFERQQGTGIWLMHASDNAPGFVGSLASSLFIQKHQDLRKQPFVVVSILPGTWYYSYVEVPVGYTNLTVFAVDESPNPPNYLTLALKEGANPTLSTYDELVQLTNSTLSPPGLSNSISVGPPLTPDTYYVGVYNPGTVAHTVEIGATLGGPAASALATVDYVSTNTPLPILDDAVTTDSITVTNTDLIQGFNIGLRVDHPRISDLAFTLISPDGSRYLLMENRGNQSTNGCGVTVISTNSIANISNSGTTNASTNFVYVSQTSGTLPISWNFFAVPDQMTVYNTTNNFTSANLIFDTGMTNGAGQTNLPFTTASGLTIVINQFGNTNGVNGDKWTYTAGGILTNYYYLAFTEDTNLTTTPIKFAPTPFLPNTNTVVTSILTNIAAIPTNITVLAGPILNTNNGHYYYLLQTNNWTGSETQAVALGGYLTTINDAAENTWVLNTFSLYGGVYRELWIGLYDRVFDTLTKAQGHGTNFVWVDGSAVTFTNWGAPEPNNGYPGSVREWYVYINSADQSTRGQWNDFENFYFDTGTHYISGVVELNALPTATTTNLGTAFSNRYYQAEQSLAPLIGTSAAGGWQLEVLDNRAGATNNATLVSWRLEFTFANTNIVFASTPVTGHLAITNTLAGGGLDWFTVKVPTNADFATNMLLFATNLPVNLLFSINAPPTTNTANDRLLLANAASGAVVFGTNAVNFPTNLVPGGTYYLGVQNTNALAVTFALEVDFHLYLPPTAPGFGAISNQVVVAGTTLAVTNAATDTNAGVLLYSLFTAPSTTATISTNAVITWNVPTNQPATNVLFITVASNSFTTLCATNFFTVTVLPLLLTNQPATNVVFGGGLNWFAVSVPTNADFATNSLLFATNLPVTLLFTTNFPPATNVATVLLLNSTNSISILSRNSTPTNLVPGGMYYLGVQNTNTAAVTCAIKVDFHLLVPANAAAFASTLPATAVTGTSATLNGFATPNGQPSMAWFAWGTNAVYGNMTTPTNVGSGSAVVYVTSPISGLTLNVPYYFYLVVSNSAGVVHATRQVLGEGSLIAWGDNIYVPTNPPAGLSNVVAVSVNSFGLALKNDGTIVPWGDNTYGEQNVPAGLTNAVAVSTGFGSAMALKQDGTVAAWGWNINGQTNVPVGLSNVITISSGLYHKVALKSDGTVAAWGYDADGETNVPVGLSNVVSIATGAFHTLALKNDGTVVSWGRNNSGQTNVPAGLTNVVMGATGAYFSLALQANGNLVAWGSGPDGETNIPPGLTNVVSVAAGLTQGVALNDDGTVASWGMVGLTNVPAGLSNVVAVASGEDISVALVSLQPVPTVPLASKSQPLVVPRIAGVSMAANGLKLQWSVPVSGMFQVQWKTNLAAAWNTITNPTSTTANGVVTFTDNGAQTAPLGPTRFYRLVWTP